MKRHILLLVPIVLILFAGCANVESEYQVPKFKKEIHLNFEILSDEIPFVPHTIVAVDDNIIISGYSGSDGPTCFVYDKSGKLVASGVSHGRGPAETILGYMNVTAHNGVVTFNDIQLQQKISFRVDEFLSNGSAAISKETVELPGWCSFFSETPDNKQVRIISKSFLSEADQPQRTIEIIGTDGGCLYIRNNSIRR